MATLTHPVLDDTTAIESAPATPRKLRTARKPAAKRTPRPAPSAPLAGRYAHAYCIGAAAVSSGLNALANAQHSDGWMTLPAAALGVVIPIAVFLLFRVAGHLHLAGFRRLALTVGAIGAVVLSLSVVHCSASIALLTGSHWCLSAALAVGIDAGMAGCEVAATLTAPQAPAAE